MTATFHIGDAIEVMSKLPEKSVDLVISSPPFLALRSYLPADHPDKALEGGSQATPGEYVDWLLDVVEACARVLAPHGSLCFELGDTYSGSNQVEDRGRYWNGYSGFAEGLNVGGSEGMAPGRSTGGTGWPLAKSLSLIPESFRWAMVYGRNPHTGRTTERWRLRNVIRWVRPNPPVGALGDKFRPATSELMVFCKSKDRYFDLDAVREPADPANRRPSLLKRESIPGRTDQVMNPIGPDGQRVISNPAGAPPLDWWNIPLLEGEEPTRYGPKDATTNRPAKGAPKETQARKDGIVRGAMVERTYHQDGGAPPLDWWNIPPGGYPGAHYAVWPPELLIKPIKAMCPEKVCRTCGEARRRITEETERYRDRKLQNAGEWVKPESIGTLANAKSSKTVGWADGTPVSRDVITLGFSDCGHDDWRPGLVLDPFAGSGTTLAVATGHGRDAIGIDLDGRNYELALDRVGPLVLELGDIDTLRTID